MARTAAADLRRARSVARRSRVVESWTVSLLAVALASGCSMDSFEPTYAPPAAVAGAVLGELPVAPNNAAAAVETTCEGPAGTCEPACQDDTDCIASSCVRGACVPSCSDGSQNQGELGIDCGGPCEVPCEAAACPEGETCARLMPSCSDGVENGDETGVDCGGSCEACVTSAATCGPDDPCDSPACAGEPRCTTGATCSDGMQSPLETGIDCGGPCEACVAAPECGAACARGSCVEGRCVSQCGDGQRSGDESGVDCGGTEAGCPRCADGAGCGSGADCVSGRCDQGVCRSCVDGVQSGGETAADCGGLCDGCAPGAACGTDADCESAVCEQGRCCGGSGADCTRCAIRLAGDTNCSGAQDNFGVGMCTAFLQCLASNPATCANRSAPECSADPAGSCNHNQFGGTLGTGVSQADNVLRAAGCAL